MLIRVGHSPDPDDAFMFYALNAGKVAIPGITIEHVLRGHRMAESARADR